MSSCCCCCYCCDLLHQVLDVLVPSVSVAVGVLVLSLGLLRYMRHLKHTGATHLTDAWKRRHTPGVWKDGGDDR